VCSGERKKKGDFPGDELKHSIAFLELLLRSISTGAEAATPSTPIRKPEALFTASEGGEGGKKMVGEEIAQQNQGGGGGGLLLLLRG
jgi:hypothetical protein